MTRIRRQLEIKRYRALHEAPPVLPAFEMELSWELSEHRRAHHEMTLLNEALELRLDECRLQLAEAADERVHLSLKASQDQLELDRLKADLARQQNDFQSLAKELDSLSFSISHDLRAPLRHLVGFTGALQEDYGAKLDAPAQGFLNCITKAGHKMEAQIEALLGLSRVARQQLCISSVDLSQLVREYAAALHGLDPERRVVFSITDRLVVQGDATLLRSAIEHLVHNAWKFTSKKEAATIEFGRAEGEDCLAFFLRDNGAGFDLRYADRLFGAFQRMHKESDFEGVGIGLATVQRIMHRHGGKIWADATVDGGATFYFTLSA
jgi:light-regulated signal transduction histidine kinase (bacteriophytochrome)